MTHPSSGNDVLHKHGQTAAAATRAGSRVQLGHLDLASRVNGSQERLVCALKIFRMDQLICKNQLNRTNLTGNGATILIEIDGDNSARKIGSKSNKSRSRSLVGVDIFEERSIHQNSGETS